MCIVRSPSWYSSKLLSFTPCLLFISVCQGFIPPAAHGGCTTSPHHHQAHRFALVPSLQPRWISKSTRSSLPTSLGQRSAIVRTASVLPTACTSERRQTLLSRDGPFFQLDRMTGRIEFGASAKLVTQLQESSDDDTCTNLDTIEAFLRDVQGLALSIWEEDMIEPQGNDVYRLQIMALRFVTLELAPWVDVEMKTVTAQSVKDSNRRFPLFLMQSINYEPNLQVIPGLRVSAESMGIVIHVAGEMRPTTDGTGVTGKIAFATTGVLPGPLRILPENVLKAASDSINQTIVDFAVTSFQRGAKRKYLEFQKKRLTEVQQQQYL